jgi:hypothetical protein
MLYPFDVNNVSIRQNFLQENFLGGVSKINKDAQAIWGRMSAQHMVEHLLWSFEISTGTTEIICKMPEHLLNRMKKFLYHNNPAPYNFKNPSLGEEPPQLRFLGIPEGLAALETELRKFLLNYKRDPETVLVHPVFGAINLEEWHRSHYKHSYHHLLQFDLIKKPEV